jgi:hypothetical protein
MLEVEVLYGAGVKTVGENRKPSIELICVRLFSAMICSMDFGSLSWLKLSSFRYIVFLGCLDDVLSECAVSDSESGTHIRKT